MFVKIVIVLLLLIVAASLLVQRTGTTGKPARSNLRLLMIRMALVLLAVAAGAALVHFLSACAPPGKGFHARDITGADYGRLDRLDGFTDHRGSRLASADFQGKAVVAFFGYTQCPDICPTTLATMKEAMRLLGPDGERVQVLFVTVDPERDTQEVLAGYVPWFDPRFLGLRADPAATRAAAQAFKVFYARAPGGSALGYSIDHTAESFAYDPQGRLRLKIAHGATAQQISEDLSKLLAGQ
jgi:protein SCO1/2